jgi:hypothetical protein
MDSKHSENWENIVRLIGSPQIAAEVKLPHVIYESAQQEYYTEGYCYDEAILVNLTINNLPEQAFKDELLQCTFSFIESVQSYITHANIKDGKRVCMNYLFRIDDEAFKLSQSNEKSVDIVNKEDAKKLRKQVLRNLQRTNVQRVYQFLLNKVLRRLKEVVTAEITLMDTPTLKTRTTRVKQDLNDFCELFINEADAEPSLDLLRYIEPPFLSGYTKIRGNKGIYGLWVNLLKQKKIIKPHLSNRLIARLINTKITNADLTEEGSELGRYYKRANDYKEELGILFSKFSSEGRFGKLS